MWILIDTCYAKKPTISVSLSRAVRVFEACPDSRVPQPTVHTDDGTVRRCGAVRRWVGPAVPGRLDGPPYPTGTAEKQKRERARPRPRHRISHSSRRRPHRRHRGNLTRETGAAPRGDCSLEPARDADAAGHGRGDARSHGAGRGGRGGSRCCGKAADGVRAPAHVPRPGAVAAVRTPRRGRGVLVPAPARPPRAPPRPPLHLRRRRRRRRGPLPRLPVHPRSPRFPPTSRSPVVVDPALPSSIFSIDRSCQPTELGFAVIPVLFEHSLRKATGDAVLTVAQVLGMEPAAARLRNPATDSEVVLALRVLEGCCLLCPACAAAAHRYNAVKVRPRDPRCTSAFAFAFALRPGKFGVLHPDPELVVRQRNVRGSYGLSCLPACLYYRWLCCSCHHTSTVP
jgi:hypothetical protein